MKVEWKARRALYYQLETSSDRQNWSIVAPSARATDTVMSWTGPKPADSSSFRVVASPSALSVAGGLVNN